METEQKEKKKKLAKKKEEKKGKHKESCGELKEKRGHGIICGGPVLSALMPRLHETLILLDRRLQYIMLVCWPGLVYGQHVLGMMG